MMMMMMVVVVVVFTLYAHGVAEGKAASVLVN